MDRLLSHWRASRVSGSVIAAMAVFAVYFFMADSVTGQSLEPIKYTLRFPAPHTHYVEIEAVMPTEGRPQVEVMMAVWTPGSYLVREYARNVESVSVLAPDGKTLEFDKTRKNRWLINTGGASSVVVSYRLYCREMGVRTNWVESEFALLNGAATYLTLVERAPRRHEVKLILPPEWKRTMSGLFEVAGGGPDRYVAEDFDTLVDSPIVAGNPNVYEFEVGGKNHYLVNVGEGVVWDGPRSVRDVEKIVRETQKMWGFLPYEKYVFLNMITEAGGGLEHKNSTVLMTSRWATRNEKTYKRWLGLVSHEYFHVWNVKRLRPVELGPFDYENEVYTKSLWISEGITSYYGDLLLRRAGLISEKEYLEGLSNDIEQLETTPGRLVQPVEEASYDAWIKGYRPDENSPNTRISYYTKGAVVGFLLDAKIRRATAGTKSLDDVMRLAYQRFSGDRGFSPDDFRRVVREMAGSDFSDWFDKVLETTEELEYKEALEWFGLRFKSRPPSKVEEEEISEKESNGGTQGENKKTWLGLITRSNNGRLTITQVRRDTPGYNAGFNADDEIIAIGDYRVRSDQWGSRLAQYRPGDKLSVLIARRERLMRLDVTLGKEPERKWQIQADSNVTREQKARMKAWLGE